MFSFTWEGAFSPTPTTLTFELRAEKDGTLLTFTHSGIGEGEGWEAYTNMGKGWDAHLKDLTSWIETGTCRLQVQEDDPGEVIAKGAGILIDTIWCKSRNETNFARILLWDLH